MDKTAFIHPKEMDFISFVLRSSEFDLEQKAWYKSRVLTRLNTLQPLVKECIEKGHSLEIISKDINNEYNDLIFLRNKFCI